MDIERNILFGIVACSAGFVDGSMLIEVIRQWSASRNRPLDELLERRGYLDPSRRTYVSDLVESLLREHADNAEAAVYALLDGQKRFLTADEDAIIRREIIAAVGSVWQRTLVPVPTYVANVGATIDASVAADLPYELKELLPSGPRYTRTSLHASGGMGKVWLAHDANIGRDVALKELRAERAGSRSIPLRFLREARITGQLEHPGVVPVYEIGRDPETGQPYYTMRFVGGRTLAQAARLFHVNRQAGRDDPLEFVTLLSAFVSVCQTIAYAHSHDIVHRDLKGENIVLGDFGEVIVLDWGLAKRLNQQDEDDEAEDARAGLDAVVSIAGQTIMGQVMGTPGYMAPEQAEGRLDLVGPRTDIFGIGAILYEILAGRPPFAGAATADIVDLSKRAEIVPPRVYWPEAPPALEAVCLKALSKNPDERYGNATELGREVQSWQDRQRRRAENELRQAGERLMQQQSSLVRLTRSEVFAAPDLTEILHQMIEVSARTLGVERVSVWRYTEDRSAIYCHLLYELSADQTSSGVELKAAAFPSYFEALKKCEVIAAHDARQDPQTREFTQSYLIPFNIGAIMDAPIHVSGRMEGVVCHEHIGPARTWMPDEQLFAIAIANLVSQAISLRENRQ